MEILTDSFYWIGSSHHVCEDYAFTGNINVCGETVTYAIISDGCSSAIDTDIGSRILCRVASKTLQLILNNLCAIYQHKIIYTDKILEMFFNDRQEQELFYNSFARNNIMTANNVCERMNLSNVSLDATVILALAYKNKVIVFMYGDGNIIVKDKDSHMLYNVLFWQNAPYYMSYKLDRNREEGYLKEFTNNKQQTTYHRLHDTNIEGVTSVTAATTAPIIYVFNNPTYIAISSDGLESFCSDDGKVMTDVMTMAKKFTDFKNITGEFVKRRIKALAKECQTNKIKHIDDISLAAIYFKNN